MKVFVDGVLVFDGAAFIRLAIGFHGGVDAAYLLPSPAVVKKEIDQGLGMVAAVRAMDRQPVD